MLTENINMIFAVIAAVIGAFSVFLMWIYNVEAARGIEVMEYGSYKHYINITYLFFVLILAFQWLTCDNIDTVISWMFLIAAAAWLLSAIMALMLSFALPIDNSRKSKMRSTVMSCILKAMLSALLLWLSY